MGFFDDPLTRRELSGMARRWQTFVSRVVVGVIMAGTVYHLWDRSAWVPYSALAELSREVFSAYFTGLMVFLPLLAVSAAGDLVTKEVRNGTLGLLFLTPLTPWRIVSGKWKAAMAQALMILFAGGPVAAICVYLGGIGAWEILWGAVLPLATAGFAAAVALFFSTVFRGPATTVIVSIVALLAGVAVPYWLLVESRGEGIEVLARAHPAFAAAVAVAPVGVSLDLSLYAWISASLVAVLSTWTIVMGAAYRLPERMRALPGPSALSRFMVWLDGFYESINIGRVRFLARSGEVWQSRALLWKELRTRASGKLRHATRIAIGLLLVATLPLCGIWDVRESIGFFIWVFAGLLVLQAVIGGVSLFVQEKEGRQWDVLLSTPLTSDQIVLSKLAGGLAPLLPTAVVGTLYATAIAAFYPDGGTWWILTVIPSGLFAIFSFVLAAAASMRCASHRAAFGTSTGILLALLLGIPAVCAALESLGMSRGDLPQVLALTSPISYLNLVAQSYRWSGWYEVRQYDGSYLLGYLFLYGLASYGLIYWMRSRFDRLAGRA